MKRKWKAGKLLVAAISMAIAIAGVSKVPVKAASVTEINLNDASKIPDGALRAHLKESAYDENGDGKLSAEEIQNITSFVLYNCDTDCKYISDFTGIEYLTELEEFNIAYACNVTSLDLSKNTNLTWVNVNDAENLSSLTLGEQKNLETLGVSNTALSVLDLKGCVNLEDLSASGKFFSWEDNHFALKNLSDCTALKSLDLNYSGIDELDVSNLSDLERLSVNNCNLEKLDCSGLVNLNFLEVERFYTGNVPFSELKLSGCTNLSTLYLSNLQISTLDISNFSKLSNLRISYMDDMETLDVSGTPITELWLMNMPNLKVLTLGNMPNLTDFSLSNALLTTLNLSGCPELTYVSIDSCKNINEINLTNNTKLTSVYLTENAIQELDVTKNTALTTLSCWNNRIRSLDVSENPALTYLTCDKNQLTSLNVSKNVSLESLRCSDNQLATLTLPENGVLNELDCQNNQLEELDLTTCPDLRQLNADCNKLKTIDLSKNKNLQKVKVSYNQLAKVDTAPSTTNLRTFFCYNNKITKLDLTENGSLREFNASDNCLPALDLSNQTNVYTDYYDYGSDILKKQVYSVTPEKIGGSRYLLRMKKETNSAFNYKKVVKDSISGINATLTEDGFVFDAITKIPFKFTYQYETNLNGRSYPMTVTVINQNSSSSVRINYSNTSIFNWNNPNPWEYTMGNGPITLKPVEKEGAKFSKWVLWNYSGNPKDLPAVTQLTDDVITDALIDTKDDYVTLRAVFEPDVVEIKYDQELKKDGSINSINDPSFKSNNPSYVEFGKTIVLKNPTRNGYVFEGWYTDPEFTANSKVTVYCEEDEIYCTDRYLYAKWRKTTSTGNNVAVPAQKGKTLTVSTKKCQVKVTSSSKTNPTVCYVKTTDKNAKTISIPDTVAVNGITYKVTEIADNAFKGNSKITKVTVGKNVKTIGKYAFSGCKKLKSITVTAGNLKTIGKNAFKGIDKKATFKVNGAKKAASDLKKKLKSKSIGYVKTWKIK